MLNINLHHSIRKGRSVQRNCDVPFAGFDPRATAINQITQYLHPGLLTNCQNHGSCNQKKRGGVGELFNPL
jgi:hypothetical protein